MLSTLRSCSIRRPLPSSSLRCSAGAKCESGIHPASSGSCCALGVIASLVRLRQLSMQLQLPDQQQQAWAAAMEGMAKLTQLTSLKVQLQLLRPAQTTSTLQQVASLSTLQQREQRAQQQLDALLHAAGQLCQCQELELRLDPASPLVERKQMPAPAAAAAAPTAPAVQPLDDFSIAMAVSTLQPLSQLTMLRSLGIWTPVQLPAAVLAHIGALTQLTGLHLECHSSLEHSRRQLLINSSGEGDYQAAVVAALRPVLPQLQHFGLVCYVQQQWQQPQQLQQQEQRSSSCMVQLLQCLQPTMLQELNLSRTASRLFPAARPALAALTGLVSLKLAGSSVTAADMAVLAQGLQRLTKLDLGHDSSAAATDRLQQRGAAVLPLRLWLTGFSSLQDLRLQRRPLTDADMQAIFDLPQLVNLDLSGAHIAPGALASALSSGSSSSSTTVGARLVKLSLKGVRLGPERLQDLGLERLRNLQVLDLRGCRPGAAAVAALRQALPGLGAVEMDGLDWAEQGLEWLIGDY